MELLRHEVPVQLDGSRSVIPGHDLPVVNLAYRIDYIRKVRRLRRLSGRRRHVLPQEPTVLSVTGRATGIHCSTEGHQDQRDCEEDGPA